jgi:hypothetical protein
MPSFVSPIELFAPFVALASSISSAVLALVVLIYRRRRYREVVAARRLFEAHRRQLKSQLDALQRHLELARPEQINSQDVRIALPALLGSASKLESSGDLIGALRKYEQVLERSESRPNDPAVTESASRAASKIAKLSAVLAGKPDTERAVERAVSTLSNISLAG